MKQCKKYKKRFGKPQHVTSAYLDKMEQRPRPTINDSESLVSFAAFLRQMVQTFIPHNFTSDHHYPAVPKIAKGKLAPKNDYQMEQIRP